MAQFLNIKMFYAVLCFIFGHILGWYTHNLQFVSEFWKDKFLLSCILFGLPCLISFWFGTKFAMEVIPELWTSRFLAAILSYCTFPIMTWYYLGESMFTVKTMACIFLSLCILLVQIFVN